MKNNLIYIHGFSSNKDDHPDLENFCKKNKWNYYSFDLPGHGKLKEKYDLKEITFDQMISYVTKKINDLNLNSFVILGHSLGGAITTYLAGKHVFGKKLKAIILECPHSIKTILRSVKSLKSSFKNISSSLKNISNSPYETFLEKFNFKKQYSSFLLKILNPKKLKEIEEVAKYINVKTMLIVSENDPLIPYTDTIDLYLNTVHNIEWHGIKNGSHTPSVKQKDEYYKYLKDFLKSIK